MGKVVDETVEDDLRYGLIVIIWARWSIVIFAFILRLYRATEISMLVITILGLLVVALINFAFHTRVLLTDTAEAIKSTICRRTIATPELPVGLPVLLTAPTALPGPSSSA